MLFYSKVDTALIVIDFNYNRVADKTGMLCNARLMRPPVFLCAKIILVNPQCILMS